MNERQQLLKQIKLEIESNCHGEDKNYYGDFIIYYDDIDKYLDRLDNIYDKISLAQWANNFKKVEELIENLVLGEEENAKYLRLRERNVEINETINFEILSSKYDFLNSMLDMVVTDINIQEQILSLSDEQLEFFKILYKRINEVSDYSVPYVLNILRKLGYVTTETPYDNQFHFYDELNDDIGNLIKEGYQFTEQEIDTLIFLYSSKVKFSVQSMTDVINFGEKNAQDQLQIDAIVEEQRHKEKKDLSRLKYALLIKTYGISVIAAKEILIKYDLTKLDLTEENKDLFEMYKAIAQIVGETNPDVLIEVYDNFSKEMIPHFDFMRTTTFENSLRKEFAKSLNREVFKTDNQNYTTINGIKVYDADTDFKMIVTALGAYQGDFKEQNDYSEYWNSPQIRSHSNCCSLIGNNNLSMAKVKNIILGFSTMSENMLLLSGIRDLNSTPNSRKFDPSEFSRSNTFTSGDDLLDRTRGDYNELVYERRDLSSNPKFYKKNPDYIVFIEEYEDIDKYIEYYESIGKNAAVQILQEQKSEQKRLWKETLKAAKDFGVPIVKINREKCAKNESQKIENMVFEFEETKNPELISKIITQFQNNRFGNKDGHHLITNAYFSKETMEKYLERIDNAILSIDDEKLRSTILDSYKAAVETEYKKVDYYRYLMNIKKISAIDFEKTLKVINALQEFTVYGANPKLDPKKGK